MKKKFVALAKADIKDTIQVKDNLVSMTIDPVMDFDHRAESDEGFCGEVVLIGTVNDNPDEKALAGILKDYLNEHVEFAVVRQVEFRNENAKENWGVYERNRKAS